MSESLCVEKFSQSFIFGTTSLKRLGMLQNEDVIKDQAHHLLSLFDLLDRSEAFREVYLAFCCRPWALKLLKVQLEPDVRLVTICMVDKLSFNGQVFQAVIERLEPVHKIVVDVKLVGFVHLVFQSAEPGRLQLGVDLLEFSCDSLQMDPVTLFVERITLASHFVLTL